MDTVTFIIQRKQALRAWAISYDIYINGKLCGRIGPGKSIQTQIIKAPGYLIEIDPPFGHAAWLETDAEQLELEIRPAGGWAVPVFPTFWLDGNTQLENPLAPIRQAYKAPESRHLLTDDQKTLLLCLDFWISFSDDWSLSEVVCRENVLQMLTALDAIGASELAAFCRENTAAVLGPVKLPLTDEQIGEKSMEDKLFRLDDVSCTKARESALTHPVDQFRRAIAKWIQRVELAQKG